MSRKSILLVEDDLSARYIYGTMLRHNGFDVVEAVSGRDAFESLQHHRFDLIVLDIGLPRVSGFEVLSALREDPRTAEIPVIVATVHVFPEEEQRAVEAGCSIFLKKPLSPYDLLHSVRSELDRAAA